MRMGKCNFMLYWLLLIPYSWGREAVQPSEGECILNFDSPVYECPDEASRSFVDTSHIEVLQHNETIAVMSGLVTFIKGIDISTMLLLEILKETPGNRYELVASHEICNLCYEISKKDGIYKKYLQYFGFPEKCPIKPGQYGIHDLLADTSELHLKKSYEGRYQVTVTIFEDKNSSCKDATFLACLKLDVVIENC